MGRIWVLVIACLVAWPAKADPTFRKEGNNGRSCEDFCAGAEWGQKSGLCLYGERLDRGGQRVGCGDSFAPGTVNLTCTCAAPYYKLGNNGTTSCDDFCSRRDDGKPALPCIGALRSDTNQGVACSAWTGLLTSGQLVCMCIGSFAEFKGGLQARTDSLSHGADHLGAELARLAQTRDQLAAARNAAEARRQQADAALSSVQSQLAGTESQTAQASESLSRSQASQQQNESAAAARQQDADSARSAMQSAADAKAAADARLAAKAAQLSTQQASAAVAEAKAQSLQEQLAAASTRLDSAPADARLLPETVGKLSGEGRVCTAFWEGTHEIRTAWHCVRGAQQLAGWRFVTVHGSVTVQGLARQDADHDAAFLTVAGDAPARLPRPGSPRQDSEVRLLALDSTTDQMALSPPCLIGEIRLATGTFDHNCASRPGMSGGVLIQDGLIVGVHLGARRERKLASVLSTGGLGPWGETERRDLVEEYNCASDCQAESKHRVCVRPLGCYDVPNPFILAACETARAADCAARTTRDERDRAASAVRDEALQLRQDIVQGLDQVHQLEDQINRDAARVATLQETVQSLSDTGAQIEQAAADLSRQAVDVGQRLQSATEKVTGLNALIAAADQAAAAAAARVQRLTAQAAQMLAQTADLKAATEAVESQIKQAEDALSASAHRLAAATAAAPDLVARLATTKAWGDAVLAVPVPEVALPKPSDWLHFSGTPELDLFGASGGGLRTAANRLLTKLSSVGMHWYCSVSHDRPACEKLAPIDVSREIVRAYCAARASNRIDSYTYALDNAGLADLAKDPAAVTIPKLAAAKVILDQQAAELRRGAAELQANRCDQVGLVGLLDNVRGDLKAWQNWVDVQRIQLLVKFEAGRKS